MNKVPVGKRCSGSTSEDWYETRHLPLVEHHVPHCFMCGSLDWTCTKITKESMSTTNSYSHVDNIDMRIVCSNCAIEPAPNTWVLRQLESLFAARTDGTPITDTRHHKAREELS